MPAPDPDAAVAHSLARPASVVRVRHPHLARNYAAHAVEGGLFIGGLAFVNNITVLPTIVEQLEGPAFLVALMPSIMLVGFLLPPIFTAHWISRLRRYVPLLLVTGLVQRLPYLVAGLALLFAAGSMPALALGAVILAPFVSGLMGGISVTGWQQLVANTVPENRRSSLFAIRYILASVLGIAAGYVAKLTLDANPNATGYAILHFWAFASLMASYAVFATLREPRVTPHPAAENLGLMQNLRAMPGLVQDDRAFALYLLARFFRNGVYILTPFLAIHARESLSAPESFLGQLVAIQMLGAIVGNSVSGYLGDRAGSKITMVLGTVVLIALAAWTPLANSSAQFQAIFFLFGFGFFASEVGNMSLALEICKIEHRSSYLAISSLINLPAMLLASWLSAALWHPEHRILALSLLTILTLALSVGFLLPIRDPRHSPPTEIPPDL